MPKKITSPYIKFPRKMNGDMMPYGKAGNDDMSWTCTESQYASLKDDDIICYGTNFVGDLTVSLDPRDSVFYSTCFIEDYNIKYSNPNANPPPPTPPPQWKFGRFCLDCDSAAISANEMTVPRWKVTDKCKVCNPTNNPVSPYKVNKQYTKVMATDCDMAPTQQQTGTPCKAGGWGYCWKDLISQRYIMDGETRPLSGGPITVDECQLIAENDPDCQGAVIRTKHWYDPASNPPQTDFWDCRCYRKDACCKTCTTIAQANTQMYYSN
jgi:hypothetical protein